MEIPAWVSGGVTNDGSVRKYHRAVQALKTEGLPVTESAVKELYMKYGGAVLDTGEVVAEEESQVEEAPKRRGRRVE